MHNVRRANLTAELGTIAKRSGPGAANRRRASLSAFFRWAIGEGLCNENPATAPHIAVVLNHLPAKLIRTYDRNAYTDEKKAAFETWANHLAVAVAKANGAKSLPCAKRRGL